MRGVGLVACCAVGALLVGCRTRPQTPEGPGFIPYTLDDYETDALEGCLKEKTFKGKSAGHLCNDIGKSAADHDVLAAARFYWKRGCEKLHDGTSCSSMGKAIAAVPVVRENKDENGTIKEQVDFDGSALDASIDPGDAASMREVIKRECERGVKTYTGEDMTGHLCALTAVAYQELEPKDPKASATYFERACTHGDKAACIASKDIQAQLAQEAKDATDAKAAKEQERQSEKSE